MPFAASGERQSGTVAVGILEEREHPFILAAVERDVMIAVATGGVEIERAILRAGDEGAMEAFEGSASFTVTAP
ncbi:MAG: hypothetical protein GY953_40675 [bacterium]|nr:hypothetical protein [bacterium]